MNGEHNAMQVRMQDGMQQSQRNWTNQLAQVSSTTEAELLLLPVSVGNKLTTAMIDSGATHNFIAKNMLDILRSAAAGAISWQHAAELLRVALADNSVVLSTKIAVIPLSFGDQMRHEVEFLVVPSLNHPLILGLQWLRCTNPVIDWRTM